MFDWYKRTVRYYNVLTELSKLTDRELSDIGVYRCQIPFLAMEMAHKPKI